MEFCWLAEHWAWQLRLEGHRQLTTQLSFNEPVFQGFSDGLTSYEIIAWVWPGNNGLPFMTQDTWPPWQYSQISREITRWVLEESQGKQDSHHIIKNSNPQAFRHLWWQLKLLEKVHWASHDARVQFSKLLTCFNKLTKVWVTVTIWGLVWFLPYFKVNVVPPGGATRL